MVHRIQHVIDESPDLIFSLDRNRRVSYANFAFAAAVASTPQRVLGSRLPDLELPAAAAAALESAARAVLKSATHREFELSLPAADGERRFHAHLVSRRG